MKGLGIVIVLLMSTSTFAQRDLTPSKRKDAFGSRDFRNLRNMGLQFQLGPTYLMTRNNQEDIDTDPVSDGYRGNYNFDPNGHLGIYGEIGLFHFPKKRSKLSLWLKTVLVSYYDYGLGFKYFRGSEDIHLDRTDISGNVVSEEDATYKFSNGNIYGRFSIHKNINLSKNWYLDNTLGINFDYRLIENTEEYNWQPMTSNSAYYKPFHVQLHYGLAVGTRLKRGSYLMVGARTPILGYQTHTFNVDGSGDKGRVIGNPALKWYSSKYWPILFHVKYMFLFEKKAKGCPPVEMNEDDRNRYRDGQ